MSAGYNCVALLNGDLIYLDICNKGVLLKRSITNAKTDRFEPQPTKINQSCVLFDRFGTPSLLYLAPDYSNKLLGVGHLSGDKWEFYEFDDDLILRQTPIFTQDQSHLYLFSDNAYVSKTFFIAILKLSGQKYVLERKIDIDFIKADAKFDRLPQPRPIVAGAAVIGQLIYIFYTGPKYDPIDTGAIDSVVTINIQSGSVVSKHSITGSVPNFSFFPHIHLFEDKFVCTNLGSAIVCSVGKWEWSEVFRFKYNLMMHTSLGLGSTVTDKGNILICYKHTPETEIILAPPVELV